MALDINPGDLLVVGTEEYPIAAVEHWEGHGFGTSAAFDRWATVACATKRYPLLGNGRRGAAVLHLTDLNCTQLDPVQPKLQRSSVLNAPLVVRETFISDGTDYARLELTERKR